MLRDKSWDHGTAYYLTLNAAVEWISNRFAGTAAPDDCHSS
jgi:hypothetical protein